ncbi:murein tetrapeptidase LD-carboxypeptidase [Kushneria sinocarnis]|uniref:Murein tetrapeptidase LD-carboxypeptidase n=1 Tax=Kushneria sinocarnis TaxID=595502 RepID=A0A420WV82_9GAMM|nr:LD-carboxypeptidase [Kushneria sinocarnis]RKR02452.1 murein tetrapeptidase LD-carboxypeptidase [Kushneria sinocarnis]
MSTRMTQLFITALTSLPDGTLSLLAPAGAVDTDRAQATVEALHQAGLSCELMPRALARHRYLAGTASARLEDLHAAWQHPGVQAVWCLRGGYGSAQLLRGIDWSRIGQAPLIGYSDITVLLEAFRRHGRPAIHAPVATEAVLDCNSPDANRQRARSLASLAPVLAGEPGGWALRHVAGPKTPLEGMLVGGNLTTLASIAGTPAALTLERPGILLLEDVGEAEYRLERSFYQLLNSLDTEQLQAVCLGSFERCQLANGPSSLEAIFREWLEPLGIALYADAPIGHGADNHAWPYGRPATLSAEGLCWSADNGTAHE